jgi:serine/threonine protein kinase
MKSLHRFEVIHRDLKPENILLDEHNRPLIGDFGEAKMMESGGRETMAGTPLYLAPECDLHGTVDYPVDVWSYSIIFAELASSKKWRPEKHIRVEIHKGTRPELSDTFVTNTQRQLICRMWGGDPKTRPSFAEICADMEMNPQCRFPGTDAVAFDEYKEYLDRGETAGICSNEFQAGIWKIYREWTNMPGTSRTGSTQNIQDIIGVVADQFAAIAHEDDESIRRTHKQLIRRLFNVPEIPISHIPTDSQRATYCLAAPPLLRRDPGFEQGERRARQRAETGDPKGICQYADIFSSTGSTRPPSASFGRCLPKKMRLQRVVWPTTSSTSTRCQRVTPIEPIPSSRHGRPGRV